MYKKIKIFIDGACIKNPGSGGYAVLFKKNSKYKVLYGGYKLTTNNRMELIAAIHALKFFKNKSFIFIYTDSKYVKLGITKWIQKWKINNWITSSKKKVKNIDLWKKLNYLIKKHIIKWIWIQSHSKNLNNEFCDKLAKYISYNPNLIDKEYLISKKK